MDARPRKSLIRKILLFAAAGLFFLIALIVAGLLMYHSAAMPAEAAFTQSERRFHETRARFADVMTTTPLVSATSTPPQTTTQTTESLQARCDRLFLELLVPTSWLFTTPRTVLDSKVGTALELAAMYDLGIRVSPQARSRYSAFQHAAGLNDLARQLSYAHNPPGGDPEKLFSDPVPASRAKRFDDTVNALKFLAVIDCPTLNPDVYDVFRRFLHPRDKQAVLPVPAELASIDLELIAPRRSLDWNQYMLQYLDYMHGYVGVCKKFSDPQFVFQRRVNSYHPRQVRNWYDLREIYVYTQGLEAVWGALLDGPKSCRRILRLEQQLQDYAASIEGQPKTPGIELGNLFGSTLQAQVIAGGLELRRGAPVPKPEQIGPDSYFFDPVLQKPYKFYIKEKKAGVVSLELCRPYAKNGTIVEITQFIINLPADHPGLENVPERK